MGTHRQDPVRGSAQNGEDDLVRDTKGPSASEESALFLDEPSTPSSSDDSEFLVQSKSPLLPSIQGLVVGPTRYQRPRHRSRRRTGRALAATRNAGHDAVHLLRQVRDLAADRGRDVLERVHAHVRSLVRRLSNERGAIPILSRLRGRGVLVAAILVLLALAALVYVTQPVSSAPRASAAVPPIANRISARQATSPDAPNVVQDDVARAARAPANRMVTDGETAPSHEVPPRAAATTGSRKLTPRTAPRPVDRPSLVGALRVTSEPEGAEVSLNGVPQGRTPLTISNLSPGSRVVSLFLPGYQRWSWSVAVVGGTQTPLAVQLQTERR